MVIIYVDVLIFLNTIVDFLLISVSACVLHDKLKTWRKVLASFVSAMFSLYIFLPAQIFPVELLLRLVSSVVSVLIAFGFNNIRRFLRSLFTFYLSSFVYAGAMAGIWMLFKPSNMSMNNGVVYFNISPLWLITASFVFYIIIVVFKKLTAKQAENATRCRVDLKYKDEVLNCTAMVDSGHSLNDMFSDSIVLFADRATAKALFGDEEVARMLNLLVPSDQNIALRFRLLPVKTVSGEKLLPAVRIDKAEVTDDKKTYKIHKPTVVISESSFSDDYSVIIPPHALKF